jgi:hypothetical protein
MAEPAPAPTTAQIAMRTAIVVLIVCAVLNVAFYPLSNLYFETHLTLIPSEIRWAFAQFTFAVGFASFVVALAPRVIGHGLAVGLGLAKVISGFVALATGFTPVLGVALLIGGGTMIALPYFSYAKHSRAAWSFLAALAGVFGLCLLFGAPKVRSLVGIGLWTTLIFPGLEFVTMTALIMLRGEYRES